MTYRLSERTARSFDIDEHTGQPRLRTGTMLDRAEQRSHRATVTATDPSGATASITVTITVTEPSRSRSDGPSQPPSDVDFEWTVEHDLDDLDAHNEWPTGLWSDGTTLWITEAGPDSDAGVYAYDLASGERRERAEFDLRRAEPRPARASGPTARRPGSPTTTGTGSTPTTSRAGSAPSTTTSSSTRGTSTRTVFWSDDETVWVVDGERAALFAYDLGSGDFLAEYRLNFATDTPRGVWSRRGDGLGLRRCSQAPLRLPPARGAAGRVDQARARR